MGVASERQRLVYNVLNDCIVLLNFSSERL